MILVTGATGHIGNVLVRKVIEIGEKVCVFLPPNESIAPLDGLSVEISVGDIGNSYEVEKALKGMDYVFHLAGTISISPGKEKIMYDVNI